MIVLDASAVADLLLNLEPRARTVARRIRDESPALYAPHLLDAEVAQVMRRYVLRGELSPETAREAIEDLAGLPITRVAHLPLIARAFELREHATVYDAIYLALAETLGAPLLTADRALARIPGHGAEVELTG